MVTSLLAIKTSLALFPGMEVPVSILTRCQFPSHSGHMQTAFGNAPSFKLTPKLHGNMQTGWARATGTAGSTSLQVTVLLCPGRCLVAFLSAGTSSRISLDWPFQDYQL